MPIPAIIIAGAIVLGSAGAGAGVHGVVKVKRASNSMNKAKQINSNALRKFEIENGKVNNIMDEIGKRELEILESFNAFSNAIEKIQGRPKFDTQIQEKFDLPKYEAEELKKVSTGAGVIIGSLSGAVAGTAGGFAAAGATTAAVAALGTASTGVAISSLSGAAATNAILAALGGGALAAGGGGMALGAVVLGTATAGVGLLVGGIIFDLVGHSLSDKASEALKQAQKTERETNKILEYFKELRAVAGPFNKTLTLTEIEYRNRLNQLEEIVANKTKWADFEEEEKTIVQNTVLLVGLLYKMCQINIVLKSEDENGLNRVNAEIVDKTTADATDILQSIN